MWRSPNHHHRRPFLLARKHIRVWLTHAKPSSSLGSRNHGWIPTANGSTPPAWAVRRCWLTYLIKLRVGRLLLESWKGSFCPLVLSSFWKVYLTFPPNNLLCVFEHLALVEVRKSPENCWMTHLHSHGTRLHVAGMVERWPELIIQLFDWAAHQNGFLATARTRSSQVLSV